ncbi:hypothetical protein H0H93_000109 [Arthromyces matolae]|nr:hypothetical protein H0H93_000109 [Arthromyces matolae]
MSLDTDLDISLPSSRELELETLLRQRDSQLSALTYEIKHLRRSIVSLPEEKTTTGQALADADADGAPAPAPLSPTDPVTLPPSLIAVLSPHLHINPGTSSIVSSKSAGNNTVNAALLQRARVLQEENDELYTLLRVGEVGRLREEVKGLRRVVKRLEGALRESHQVITTLSNELDKTHTALLSSAQRASHTPSTKSISQSPRASYRPISPIEHTSATANGPSGGGGGRLPPTGPRAYKKPRLSAAPSSQSHSQARQRSDSWREDNA